MCEKYHLHKNIANIGQALKKRKRPPDILKYIKKLKILSKPNPAKTGIVLAGFFHAKNDDLTELLSKKAKVPICSCIAVYGQLSGQYIKKV